MNDQRGPSRLRVIGFIALCVAQLAIAGSGIARYERTLRSGTAVLLQVAPVDPADPFRGRYVALSFAIEQGSHKVIGPGLSMNRPVYAVLALDAAGVATVTHVTATEPPPGELYLRATPLWAEESGSVHIRVPFGRYYMNEALAPAAETAYGAALGRTESTSHARVRVRDGRAVLEAVLLDGEPIEQAARKHAERERTKGEAR